MLVLRNFTRFPSTVFSLPSSNCSAESFLSEQSNFGPLPFSDLQDRHAFSLPCTAPSSHGCIASQSSTPLRSPLSQLPSLSLCRASANNASCPEDAPTTRRNSSSSITSSHSRSSDGAGEHIHDQDDTVSRYKTELCRSFVEKGQCRYGPKCQFAHGYHDLRVVHRHSKYKSEPCKSYHVENVCLYGSRCCFIHSFQRHELAKVISQNVMCIQTPSSKPRRLPVFVELASRDP